MKGVIYLYLASNQAAIVFKIPADLLPAWILYCRRNGKTQSRMVREAIAYLIDNDNSATDKELAMAARMQDYGYPYDPRGIAEQ